MSIASFIRNLFTQAPQYHTSAYGAIYSAVVARLAREGVWVGGTSHYPRVEVNSIVENERLDKEGAVRQLSLVTDSISDKKLSVAVALNDTNLELLTGSKLEAEGWDIFGVVPTLLQDLTESVDGHLLYRITQRYDIFVEKVKTDIVEEAPAQEAPAATPKRRSKTTKINP